MSKVVVLDVPHHWDACIKDVLERANDVLIVATPDLASLRNTKNLLDVLKGLRPGGHEPMVLLSMVGASKASEISEKDFAGAIGAKPVVAFEFDPRSSPAARSSVRCWAKRRRNRPSRVSSTISARSSPGAN